MIVSTRTKLVGTLSGVALAAALLPGATASGTDGPTVPITGGGVLRLHLGGDADFFRFYPPTSSGAVVGDPADQDQEVRRPPSTRPPRW